MRDKVIELARTYLGVAWRHQGRTRHGIDCAGLVLLVGKELELLAPELDVIGYARRPNKFTFLVPFRENMNEKPLAEARCGDVLIFADGPYPCHTGFLTEKYNVPHFIHAYAGMRKVLEQPYDERWKGKATHCFEYRGVDREEAA